MLLDDRELVGDFMRIEVPRTIDKYKQLLGGVLTDKGTDEHTRDFLQKKIARLEELESRWVSAWNRCLVDPGITLQERDEIVDAVRQTEGQLSKEFVNIFKRSRY